jgi:hypothetical protein
MRDAEFFRAQAEICLEVARQTNDSTLAERLRDRAEQHFARALKLTGPQDVGEKPSSLPQNPSALLRRYFFAADFNGVIYEDKMGEVFLTAQDAEAYAAAVARELAHGRDHSVTVYLIGEDGDRLGQFRSTAL